MKSIVIFFTLIVIGCLSFASGQADSISLANRIIVVKGDHYYPPYEFLNEKGEPDGFNVELFAAIARELGIKYKLELGQWSQVWDEVKTGRADVLLGVMVSSQRAEVVRFGISHSVMTHGIFTRIKDNYVTLEELRGKEIIVQDQDRMHEFLIEQHLTDKIILVKSQLEALQLLASGKHDAALLGNFQGAHLIRKLEIKNLMVTSSEIEPQKYAMVTSKNNDELLWLLNMGLFQLKENGEYDRIYQKWFGVYEKENFFREYRVVIIVVVSALILMLGFVLLLRNRVRKATLDLRKAHHNTLQLVDELKKAKNRAEESDRLKSAFLANMSHEIRTPLNSIIGFSELLDDADFEVDQKKEFVDHIISNGNSLLNIISDIMDISKMESGEITIRKSKVDVMQFLDEIRSMHIHKVEQKDLRLEIDYLQSESNWVVFVLADKERLQQIFNNLISNALKFTSKGHIQIGYRLTGQMVEFHVKDTGIGISADYHHKVFDRFWQVEASYTRKFGGNGLGLAISKKLVELMGGQIRVESEVGKGSTFYFTLPLYREPV